MASTGNAGGTGGEVFGLFRPIPGFTWADCHARFVVADYVDVIVHVFSSEARAYYAFEKLWA